MTTQAAVPDSPVLTPARDHDSSATLPTVCDTRIAKWKDGKRAVFLLAFDDSCPSHVHHAVPMLQQRGLVGTFYINPGAQCFQSERGAWEEHIPTLGMEYGNHTWSHIGALNVTEFQAELEKSNQWIQARFPERRWPRLVSFARPGVPKDNWRLSDEQLAQSLTQYHLIPRPDFFGPPHIQSVDAMQQYVETAIAGGEMGHLDFHGVGGDWHSVSLDCFTAILDTLASCRDRLWITDAISYHQYRIQRASAQMHVLSATPGQIRLRLSCQADAAFYDLPLTLSTRVPAEWTQCEVVQEAMTIRAAVVDGEVRYSAIPGPAEIIIRAARGASGG